MRRMFDPLTRSMWWRHKGRTEVVVGRESGVKEGHGRHKRAHPATLHLTQLLRVTLCGSQTHADADNR